MHDFDWFLDRVNVARWEDETPGSRSCLADCPVCGGHDPLHLTEKNGKCLVQCFSCAAKYKELIAAFEERDGSGEESEEDDSSTPTTPSTPTGITVTFKGRTKKGPQATQTPPVAPVADPLAWYAEYCGVELAWLKANIPVRSTPDAWLAHYWDTSPVTKDRQPNSANRRWSPKGANGPRLWPTLPDAPGEEIWLAEGETDVICLRAAGVTNAYTSGSATTVLTSDEMKGLKERGVERIVVAYDNDKAGLKARQECIENARKIGLGTSIAILGDPLLGGPKDWRERWLSGEHSIPLTSSALSNASVYRLDEVDPADEEALLLGRLHPADHTILFGDGGTGKGVIAAWWATQLATGQWGDELKHKPMNVLVVDYEAHARHEWRPRIEHFAGKKASEAMKHVFILQPDEAIWDIATLLHEIVVVKQIDYVIVDSVTYACLGQEVEKSSTAAQYSVAIAQIKAPVLSLAHTTKIDPDPQHPFGSVFWSNGARVTIAVARTDIEDPTSPRKLACKKANQNAFWDPVQIPWEWVTTGLPVELTEEAYVAPQTASAQAKAATKKSQATTISNALITLGHGTVKEIWEQAQLEDETITIRRVSNHLGSLGEGGLAAKQGDEWVSQSGAQAKPRSVHFVKKDVP